MKISRYADSQTLNILKPNEAGIPVPELCRRRYAHRQLLKVARQIRRYGYLPDVPNEKTGGGKPVPEEDVCLGTAEGRDDPRSDAKKVVRLSSRQEVAKQAVEQKGISVRIACQPRQRTSKALAGLLAFPVELRSLCVSSMPTIFQAMARSLV